MNREIKFRGFWKDIDGKLHYKIGNLNIVNNKEHTGCYISNDYGSPFAYKVIPETIGQYTGLKDKNGKEIYEGDIVTGENYPFIEDGKQNYVGIVVFYVDCASFGYSYQCVRKDKRGISNGISNEFEANEDLICENVEIIGNIYEREVTNAKD